MNIQEVLGKLEARRTKCKEWELHYARVFDRESENFYKAKAAAYQDAISLVKQIDGAGDTHTKE